MTPVPRFWTLAAGGAPRLAVSLDQVSTLMHKLGVADRHAVAEALLALVGSHVPLAQCTIFLHSASDRPRIVAVGDRARIDTLPRISQDYVTRFYALDGSVQVMREWLARGPDAAGAPSRIVLHRQSPADIPDPAYRAICYAQPRVAERLAVLGMHERDGWFSVNFYRGLEHGMFDAEGVAVVEAFAPLVVQVVRLHFARQHLDEDLSGLLLARLKRRCPALTKRDLDVVRGVLSGAATEGIADQMGIEASSARTYLKRVYRKLGVSGQRDLLGLLMEREGRPV